MIKVNMSEVKKKSTLLENGKYPFQIVSVTEGKSKTGNDMFKVIFEERDSHKKIDQYFPLIPSRIDKLKEFLTAIRQPCEGNLALEGAEWIGLWVIGDVEQYEYKKKDGTMTKGTRIIQFSKYDNNKEADTESSDIPF